MAPPSHRTGPARPRPRAYPRPARPLPGRLPSPSSRMRTSRFIAADPTPAGALSQSSALTARPPRPHFRPRSHGRTSEPGGPERPGCAAVPPRGRTRHCWRCTGQGAGPRPRVLLSPSSFPSSFPLGQDQPTLGRMALLGPQFWTGYRRSGIWAEADFRPGRRARPRAGGAWRDQQTMRQYNPHVYFKCTGRNIEKHSCANKHFTHAWGLGNLHTESPESIQCEGTELSYPAILPSTRFSTNPACLSGEPLPRPV